MSELKLKNLNDNYKVVTGAIRSHTSKLQGSLTEAITQQSYIHKNPDGNITEEDLAVMQTSFLELVIEFNKLGPMVDDMTAVHTGAMTPDELITKYSVDVDGYSNDLEDPDLNWE